MEMERGEYHELLRLGFKMDISLIQALAIAKNTSNSFKRFLAVVRLTLKPFLKRKVLFFKTMQSNVSSLVLGSPTMFLSIDTK